MNKNDVAQPALIVDLNKLKAHIPGHYVGDIELSNQGFFITEKCRIAIRIAHDGINTPLGFTKLLKKAEELTGLSGYKVIPKESTGQLAVDGVVTCFLVSKLNPELLAKIRRNKK